MSSKTLGFCQNCHRYGTYPTQNGQCSNCGEPLVKVPLGYTYAAEFSALGRAPSQEEYAHLRTCAFGKASLSANERSAFTKRFWGYIGMGVLIFAVSLVLLLVLAGFVIFNIMSMLGMAAGVGIVIYAIVSYIGNLAGSNRAHKPKAAFEKYWSDSVLRMHGVMSSHHFEGPEFASSGILRMVPEDLRASVDKSTLENYIQNIQHSVMTGLVESQRRAEAGTHFSPDGYTEGNILTAAENMTVEEVSEGLVKVSGTLSAKQGYFMSEGNNDTLNVDLGAARITASGYFVQNGKFWFPTDVMPEFVQLPYVLPDPTADPALQ